MAMRNIKLVLAYDGSHFSGWQSQPTARTVQGEVEEKLAMMCQGEVALHGAGRTDAGVHALAMVANFNTTAKISCLGFKKGLNSLLSADIRILKVDEVAADFHARISAKAKTYRYFFSTAEIQLPTLRLYEALVSGVVDIKAMQDVLPLLVGKHDFSSFEAVGSRDLSYVDGRGAVRTLEAVSLKQLGDEAYCLTIRGTGFLRKMVRNIVGTLFDVGRQRISKDDFNKILQAQDRNLAGATAPACGLFLDNIEY